MTEKTYRIGEAADYLRLKTYVLRFWETEFPQLRPLRTEKGQRLYSQQDLALLQRIRYLLHERGMTIEGARRVLLSGDDAEETAVAAAPSLIAVGALSRDDDNVREVLRVVCRELEELRRMLASESHNPSTVKDAL